MFILGDKQMTLRVVKEKTVEEAPSPQGLVAVTRQKCSVVGPKMTAVVWLVSEAGTLAV
jgi:hypothetical protein